jgi:Caspase domain
VKGLWVVVLVACSASAAEPVRLLVSIGNDVGDPADAPLDYAERDAERVAALFTEVGEVASRHAVVVVGQPTEAVQLKLAETIGQVRELTQQGRDVTLFVYVSSHAREGFFHWRGTRYAISELRSVVESSGARFTVLVVDACDSGLAAQARGGRVVAPFSVSVTPSVVRGSVYVASSGPAEASQEQAQLRGGLFTHHWLTGLRGDADVDGDGQVSLNEAYGHAYRRTVAGAAFGGQHPTFDIDATGTGEVVLTRPSTARSTVVFPSELEGDFVLVRQPRADIVAELQKERGRVVRLAVTPGRYSLRKRMGLRVGVTELDLPYGGQQLVDERSLQIQHFAEVASKGGLTELHPWSIAAWADLENEQLQGHGPRVHGGVSLRGAVGAWWARAGLGMTGGLASNARLTTSEVAGTARLSAGWRLLDWAIIPYVGVLLDVRVLRQAYVRTDEAAIERVFGLKPLEPRWSTGLGVGAVGGVEVPLGSRLVLGAEVFGLARYLPAEGQAPVTPGVGASLLMGIRL